MGWYGYAPYVPVAKRREEATRKIEKLKKKGQKNLARRHRRQNNRQKFLGQVVVSEFGRLQRL